MVYIYISRVTISNIKITDFNLKYTFMRFAKVVHISSNSNHIKMPFFWLINS